jgi:hypothetical protein
MDKNPTYTTGQVSGMTGLAFMSLYRYVRTFREFFSPEVQQHTRGRRWLDRDITLVLSIQSLFSRRIGEEETRQAIQDGWRLDLRPEGSPELAGAFALFFETCKIYEEEAKRDRAAAREYAAKLKNLLKHTHDDHDLLLQLQKGLINQQKEINELRTRKSSFINFGQHQ